VLHSGGRDRNKTRIEKYERKEIIPIKRYEEIQDSNRAKNEKETKRTRKS
jgi:hypothetical protein